MCWLAGYVGYVVGVLLTALAFTAVMFAIERARRREG